MSPYQEFLDEFYMAIDGLTNNQAQMMIDDEPGITGNQLLARSSTSNRRVNCPGIP
jgi:hypothetical protein